MKRSPTLRSSLQQDTHPASETFERVLGHGIVVERRPGGAYRHELWSGVSVVDVDLLEGRSNISTLPWNGNERRKTQRE
jgi:hypothetical protein